MKYTKHAKVLGMLCIAALLLFIPPAPATVQAAEYEPKEVELPYTHRYSTTDGTEDSLLHYVIVPQEDAPLPAEVDSKGMFSYKGVSGNGEKDGDRTVYLNTGTLTFTFSKPGVYTYELSADLNTDNSKENVERYTFEPRKFTIHFYIVNAEEGSMKLEMLTAEDDRDVKPNEVILDPSYQGPAKQEETETEKPEETETETVEESETTKPEETVKPDKPDKPDKPAKQDDSNNKSKKSNIIKTGDESTPMIYLMLMIGSFVAFTAIYVNKRRKGSEDDA